MVLITDGGDKNGRVVSTCNAEEYVEIDELCDIAGLPPLFEFGLLLEASGGTTTILVRCCKTYPFSESNNPLPVAPECSFKPFALLTTMIFDFFNSRFS